MQTQIVPGLPQPKNDLRRQLLNWVTRRSIAFLELGDRARSTAYEEGRWEDHNHRVKEAVAEAYGPMPFNRTGGPLKVRTVSSFDTTHCSIENLLFESFPGWEVNASVFVPRSEGPFIPVVIPVGHSGKQFANYQIPAQAFASLGYLAVLFDPPGQSSEKQPGNDHFRDGIRSFPFGHSSNRYFILDALRCIDYLETRADVDLSRGVGMTGVSGGGVTTLYASLFDNRIACIGPSCCMNKMADHPIGDAYSACPESFWHGRIRDGIDNIDIAAASFPKPMLLMAGKYDEVFTAKASRKLADEIGACYGMAGGAERFRYFEDDSGHAYTLTQVSQFCSWMKKWIENEQAPELPAFSADDFSMLDYSLLQCRPAEKENMFSISIKLIKDFTDERNRGGIGSSADIIDAARNTAGRHPVVDDWRESGETRLWTQMYTEGLLRCEELETPVSILGPIKSGPIQLDVMYVDDRGRKAALEAGGIPAGLSQMLDRDAIPPQPSVWVPDLPGWGESTPALSPYALSPWGSMDRTLNYPLYGLGDGLIPIKARALSALIAVIRGEKDSSKQHTVIVGRRLGGLAALLAAALSGAETLILYECLYSIQDLLEEEVYSWTEGAFLPGVLKHYDLPELYTALAESGVSVHVINPLDGAGRELDSGRYADLPIGVHSGLNEDSAAEYMLGVVSGISVIGA
ncbi:MAG: hypothetical protein HN368_20880 [Spirochaetales bacterium]|jgi:dienelactone hydrolase|nr:hypothetical protein [Spirochaetales bacterium]